MSTLQKTVEFKAQPKSDPIPNPVRLSPFLPLSLSFPQAITAAGSGCEAAIAAERYLTGSNLVVERKDGAGRREEAEKEREAPPAAAKSAREQEKELDLALVRDGEWRGFKWKFCQSEGYFCVDVYDSQCSPLFSNTHILWKIDNYVYIPLQMKSQRVFYSFKIHNMIELRIKCRHNP